MSTKSRKNLQDLPTELVPLFEAGLSLEIVTNAVLEGEVRRNEATRHHPATAGGFYAWAERVRALRDAMVQVGWAARDHRNLPTLVSPCGRYELGTVTGDERTGLRGGDQPRTQYAKGIATQDAVRANQLNMFGPDHLPDAESRSDFWILLVRRVPVDDSEIVRLEISRPSFFNANGVITGWKPRFILEPIDLGPTFVPRDDFNDAEGVDVEVRRRNK